MREIRNLIMEISKSDNQINILINDFKEGKINDNELIFKTIKTLHENNEKYKKELISYDLMIW